MIIIGEKLNGSIPSVAKAIAEKDADLIRERARMQAEAGATFLDVCASVEEDVEVETLKWMIDLVQEVTDTPICVDSPSAKSCVAAIPFCKRPGLINSVSLEGDKIDTIFPVIADTDWECVALLCDNDGIPDSVERRMKIFFGIMEKAKQYGIAPSRLHIDPLVVTLGTDQTALTVFADCCRRIKYEYPEIHITSGLSNISFGLPERLFVNSSFMALAIGQGLTMAIANPSQDLLMHAVFAADLLMNKPDADLRYINRVSEHKISVVSGEVDAVQTTTKKSGSGSKDLIPPEHEGDKIFEAVVKGRKNKIETLVQDALQGGIDAQKVIDESLIPAINHVGVLFDKQIYFLPQLISSAETMETGIGVVEPILAANRSSEPLGTIVIATVEHDIHDIGKNLVALMLRNYGYRVVDLGKDVPAEDIIQAAIREKADIIGLSALMTTTMMEMKKVVNMVREQNLPVKVMIGGAVITRSFADEIGAEGYSKDAQEAVVEVARLLGR